MRIGFTFPASAACVCISVLWLLFGQTACKRQEGVGFLVIGLVQPEGAGTTETRVIVNPLQGDPATLLLTLRGPNYQLEAASGGGMPGLMAPLGADLAMATTYRGAALGLAGDFLPWASGAVHEYSATPLARPSELSAVASRLRPPEKTETLEGTQYYRMSEAIPVFSEGSVLAPNRLAGWKVVESDGSFPVTFKVVAGKGYVYLCGKGAVQDPAGRLHRLAPGAPARWVTALRDRDPLWREGAALALGWIGKGRPEMVPALIASLKDTIPMVRRNAAEALGKLGDPSARIALEEAARDSHVWTAATAKWAVANLGPAAPK